MGELMKHGCTTCFDHHYVFPAGSGDLLGAQFAAADELGIRMYASRGSMDLSKKDGGLPPDSVVQTVDEILRDSVHAIEAYHDASYGAMHRVALAPCSPFSVSADLLRESAKLARQYGVRLHTHLCETKDEENFMLAREGVRPLAYMERLGWIGDDVWFAHGIHFNDVELRLLAQTGTGVALCPISNMKLASGIAPVARMIGRGLTVGIGTDGPCSNNDLDMWDEMRTASLLQKVATGDASVLPAYETLRMATVGGACAVGMEGELGVVAPGARADLILVDMGGTHWAPGNDPIAGLVYNAKSTDVDTVLVDGRILVERGELIGTDTVALVREASRRVERIERR